jgi:hypothetical protein
VLAATRRDTDDRVVADAGSEGDLVVADVEAEQLHAGRDTDGPPRREGGPSCAAGVEETTSYAAFFVRLVPARAGTVPWSTPNGYGVPEPVSASVAGVPTAQP